MRQLIAAAIAWLLRGRRARQAIARRLNARF